MGRAVTTATTSALSPGARQRAQHKAKGLCPSCHFDHDGSRFIFCFECRQEQSERAKRWYRRNREKALQAKRERDKFRRLVVT
jgi:hypothetical protein